MRPITDATAAKDKSVPKLLTQVSSWKFEFKMKERKYSRATSWNVFKKNNNFQMDHHQGCVNTTRWSNNGHFLASGGEYQFDEIFTILIILFFN